MPTGCLLVVKARLLSTTSRLNGRMEICEALAELKSEIVGMYMKQVGFITVNHHIMIACSCPLDPITVLLPS